MAATTTAPSISAPSKGSSFGNRISAMFDKLSPSDRISDRDSTQESTPQVDVDDHPPVAKNESKSAKPRSLPRSQSHNNAKGNTRRDLDHQEHVGDGERLDHKDSKVGEKLSLPQNKSDQLKDGGDEAIAKRPEEKGIGGRSDDLTAEDFEALRILGTGTFARVWQVKMKDPEKERELGLGEGRVYALKVLRKDQVVKLKQIDHVKNERTILGDVAGHPFITTLITTFSDRDCLYMLLDYCPGGEIFSYLRKQKRFSENVARFYICEIVLIFEFLHEKEGVAYRDLKPENLLLDAKGHVKLVDFGFAKRVKDRETYTLCGTPEYLAPEVIQSQGHTTAVDWWALGILLFEFITGYPPFWHSNPMEIYKQILHKPVAFPENPSSYEPLTEEAKDLITQLLTVDRSKRIGNLAGGAADVKGHPWFKGVDWDKIYHREYDGPIIPALKDEKDASCFERYDMEERTGLKCGGVKEGDYHSEWDGVFDDF